MEKISYVVSVFACLFLIACSQEEGGRDEVMPVRVKTQRIGTSAFTSLRHYSGTVEEEVGASLSFSVPGTLQHVYVKVGSRVKKGELLASIDPTSFKSSYDAAKVTLSQAQDVYRRMKELYDKKSLPEIKWIDVQTKLQQAVSMEEVARENLTHCNIYSPFEGVISDKKAEIGQNVAPGIPVLKLNSVSRVKVRIAVPEAEVSQVILNGKAQVEVTACGGETFEGIIVEKGVEAHSLSHAYEVKISVDNPEGKLMPGMVARVTLAGAEGTSRCILPARLVQLDEHNQNFIWICQGGKAEKRVIGCGAYRAEGVEVVSGLTGNEEVIVEGQQKVSNGTVVTSK